MNRETVVSKIKKLLTLAAEDGNGADNERATALRQANALMDKYGVSIADTDGDELGERGEDRIATGTVKWKCNVIASIARLYGCATFRTRGSAGQTAVIGRAHYREIVLSMSDYAIKSIQREMKHHAGRRAKNSFGVGASHGIYDAVNAIMKARERDQAGPGTALVLVDQYRSELAANDALMRAQYNLRSCGASQYRPESSAYRAGTAHGGSINLSGQVGGSQRQPRQLTRS